MKWFEDLNVVEAHSDEVDDEYQVEEEDKQEEAADDEDYLALGFDPDEGDGRDHEYVEYDRYDD